MGAGGVRTSTDVVNGDARKSLHRGKSRKETASEAFNGDAYDDSVRDLVMKTLGLGIAIQDLILTVAVNEVLTSFF